MLSIWVRANKLLAALLAGPAVKASWVFVAYAVGMGALALTAVQLSSYVGRTIVAEIVAEAEAPPTKLSRVEVRLKQVAKAKLRVPRAAHPDILAYRAPKIHPAALAMAMHRTEHPVAEKEAGPITVAQATVSDAIAVDRGSAEKASEPIASGPRVAGFMAVAVSEADDAPAETAEQQVPAKRIVAEKSRKAAGARRYASHSARAKRQEKKKSFWVASEVPFELGSSSERVRIVDTPGAIIRRQLGGTT